MRAMAYLSSLASRNSIRPSLGYPLRLPLYPAICRRKGIWNIPRVLANTCSITSEAIEHKRLCSITQTDGSSSDGNNGGSSSNGGGASQNYWASLSSTGEESTLQQIRTNFPNLKYDDEALQLWTNAFDNFDFDRDGYISHADLQKSPTFTLEKIKLLKQYDRDNNNLIDISEFIEAMYNVDVQSLKHSYEGFDGIDLQLEFRKYSVEGGGGEGGGKSGGITREKVLKLMNENDFTCCNKVDAERLFKEMDIDGDGSINFDDFNKWLKV